MLAPEEKEVTAGTEAGAKIVSFFAVMLASEGKRVNESCAVASPLTPALGGAYHCTMAKPRRNDLCGIAPAQELVYDGWEILDADLREAKKCFSRAITLDPDIADAYNGLAEVAMAKGDLVRAEKHYVTAYEKAKAALGTEDRKAFAWWGELDTRPYMRSRHGLGLLYLEVGRHDEAIALFEDLLRRNPNDNQGARYLVAPAYLMKGDLKGALKAFAWFDRHYAEDIPDPHFLMNWGLASFMAGHFEDAAMQLRKSLFANPYLVPLVLGRRPRKLGIWHSDNLMELDYAREYFPWYGELWSGQGTARSFAEFIWEDAEIQADFRRWIDLWTKLKGLEPSRTRTALVREADRIESKAPSLAFFSRLKIFVDQLMRPA